MVGAEEKEHEQMSDDLNQARSVLAEAVNQAISDVPDDASVETFDPWDSLAHARLMMGLEEKLDRQLTTMEIVSLMNLEDIAMILG